MNSNATTKKTKYDYDLIVIGSGAAGSIAAHSASSLGKRVCIVEMNKFGGDMIHGSTIPTKSLLETAKTLNLISSAHKYGIRVGAISYNFRSIKAYKEQAIHATGVYNEIKAFKADSISTMRGHAHFINKSTINVGLKNISARQFIIASGANSFIPNIAGLNNTGYITYSQANQLDKPPKSIFIIGGGTIACEYAQIFASFGTKVHVSEIKDHLLPEEDYEVGDSIHASLADLGIRIHTSTNVAEVSGKLGRKIVAFEHDGQQHRANVEEIMIACGKYPNLDIGLNNAGINTLNNAVKINKFMQTNKKHVYAVGECTGEGNSPHLAIQQARLAVHNMFSRKKIAIDYRSIPRVVFGSPEIATVGYSEHQLLKSGQMFQTAITPIGMLGKAITTNYSSGFVKIIATHSGILLGASIVAPNASEMVGELSLAIHKRMYACDIAKTVQAIPTWSEAIRVAASKIECI